MRTALITTTIRIPHVLALYRAYAGPEVAFFVAGDEKTPDDTEEFADFIGRVGNTHYYTVEGQEALYPKLCQLLGRNTSCRRNIALLEALKWGADTIVSIDDDNIPTSGYYFRNYENLFDWETSGVLPRKVARMWHGLQATSPAAGGWVDPGFFLLPPVRHRGMPHAKTGSPPILSPVVSAKVGVAAGLWMGEPDIDACDRIATHPRVTSIQEVLRSGVVVDPRKSWTVFNSQNVAFVRELAPAFMMVPGVGRHEDIVASMVCQRVMRELGYVVHLGLPLVYQERNPHNLLKDLEQEMWGMEHTLDVAAALDNIFYIGDGCTVLGMVERIWHGLGSHEFMPRQAIETGFAWVEDCRAVLC